MMKIGSHVGMSGKDMFLNSVKEAAHRQRTLQFCCKKFYCKLVCLRLDRISKINNIRRMNNKAVGRLSKG